MECCKHMEELIDSNYMSYNDGVLWAFLRNKYNMTKVRNKAINYCPHCGAKQKHMEYEGE